MKKFYNIKGMMLLLLVTLMAAACKTEKVLPKQEALKDISGSWQVIKATRNGTDLAGLVDFGQFRINFDGSGYKLTNRLPFIVNQDGMFALDDPEYPYKITFTAAGGTPVSTAFTYPIVNGKRQLSLTFSPGCANNSYVYVLQKVN
ncbi:DUF5004 domain-containing protein [Mucilaginibacter sp. AK015]|uniref:DUF5004 domain-containing protein n=1 Tax=Mucilaginibacter sp. AK015 TaxID=2723072 RepID=UPI00160FDEEF|nr:DUF5004 domain-containing protein [Mucilaginibacter sp. AK015]MBB5394094.1 hypothetical protein [Mucilaginibacter sp. AK015]